MIAEFGKRGEGGGREGRGEVTSLYSGGFSISLLFIYLLCFV